MSLPFSQRFNWSHHVQNRIQCELPEWPITFLPLSPQQHFPVWSHNKTPARLLAQPHWSASTIHGHVFYAPTFTFLANLFHTLAISH